MKKIKKSLFLPLAMFMLLNTACSPSNNGDNTNGRVSIWGTYSLAKVMKDPALNANNVQLEAKLDVAAANGETESGQIIVTTGDKGVKEYTVETADLTNKNGDVYKAQNVEVFNQWYVLVDLKSFSLDPNSDLNADHFPAHDPNGAEFSGYTPDALIPQKYSIQAKENYIDPNANQGITFDFNVPVGTPAGEYTGEFTLKIDGKNHKIPVKLTVWSYDVSEIHGMNLWDINEGHEAIGEMSSDYENMYYTYYDALMKYKINAYHLKDWHLDEKQWLEDLREYWDKPSFGGVFLPDIGGDRSVLRRWFTEIAKGCVEDGINYFSKIRFYHQKVDELHDKPGAADNALSILNVTTEVLAEVARELKEGTLKDNDGKTIEGFEDLAWDLQEQILEDLADMPQVFTTYYDAAEQLQGKVDSFGPGTLRREFDRQRRLHTYNAEVLDGESWCYTSLYPLYPYGNVNRVDDYLHGGRILGWMRKDWEIPGYLNWMCNFNAGFDWSENGFNSMDMRVIDVYTNPNRCGSNRAQYSVGDGYLFYPMAKYHADSPIPSVRLLTTRDSQEDYHALCELEEAYMALTDSTQILSYGVGTDYAVENLEKTMDAYYSTMYTGLYYVHDDVLFERVRRSLGGLLDAAYDESQTMIMQEKTADGAYSKLKIYSRASEMYVNGEKLTKTNGYYTYTATLNDGINSVNIKYKVGDETKSFEFILANKTYSYDVNSLETITTPAKGNSTVTKTQDGALDFYVASYGGDQLEMVSTKLEYDLPFTFDYERVKNFNFTVQNTCGENVKITIYLISETNSKLKIDETIVFPYEEYTYTYNSLYERVAEMKGKAKAIRFEFENYKTSSSGMSLLPDRTVKIYDVSYSFK